jgi:hypothetical protein
LAGLLGSPPRHQTSFIFGRRILTLFGCLDISQPNAAPFALGRTSQQQTFSVMPAPFADREFFGINHIAPFLTPSQHDYHLTR